MYFNCFVTSVLNYTGLCFWANLLLVFGQLEQTFWISAPFGIFLISIILFVYWKYVNMPWMFNLVIQDAVLCACVMQLRKMLSTVWVGLTRDRVVLNPTFACDLSLSLVWAEIGFFVFSNRVCLGLRVSTVRRGGNASAS